MNTTTKKLLRAAASVALISTAACGDDHATSIDAAQVKIDAPGSAAVSFHQVEQLARPGINEALLITNDFMNGYNATAPFFVGVGSATLDPIVGEAKTVLKALYLGTCFIDLQVTAKLGSAAFNGSNELKPAGQDCEAVVGTLINTDGTITASAGSAAQAYADLVFSQFEPDVMRIDTSVTVSTYFSPCGGTTGPLLCGGRGLTDDVIDVTYDYLLAGAKVPLNAGGGAGLDALKQHLVSDGVAFSATTNNLNALAGDATNSQQGHTAPSATFPYSAKPF